jgi:hypothetical protein
MLRSPLYEALWDLFTGLIYLFGVIVAGLIFLWILSTSPTTALVLLGLGIAWAIGRTANSDMREP